MKKFIGFLTLIVLSFFSLAASQILVPATAVGEAEFDALIQQKYPADGAGALVLVLKGDEVLLKKAYGRAVIEFQVPMNIESPFNLGSITKQFTAVSILMLQQAGKLHIDHEVKQYVPEYKQAHSAKITLRNLLTHTAGIPGYDGKNGYTHHGTEADSFETILAAFNDLPLDFSPGTNVNYSNSGYVLLGRIIEKVSGLSYQEFVRRRIFAPLGMQDSSFFDYYRVLPGLAKGYEISDSSPYKTIHGKASKPSLYGDGGITSTLNDMTKWYRAIRNNSLIDEQSKQLAFSTFKLTDGRDSKHALGWKVSTLGKFKTIEHGGSNHGFENYVLQLPEQDLTIMIFSNLNRSYPGELAERLANTLVNQPIASNREIELEPAVLEQFTGNYRYPDGTKRTIEREGTYLYSVRGGGARERLVPFASNQFYFESAPVYWLRFEKEPATGKNVMYSESRVSPYIRAEQL